SGSGWNLAVGRQNVSVSRAETPDRARARKSEMSAVRRQTDELVQSLVSELRPVPRAAILLRLLAGATAGSALSAVLLILLVGARPDLAAVARSFGFWAK